MIKFNLFNTNKLHKLLCLILLFLLSSHAFAQQPECDFKDLNSYFYHWGFDAENSEFEFGLQNNTVDEIKDKISMYEIVWGDGDSDMATNEDFPVKHIYAEGQYQLKISITYYGEKYDYIYTVYNTIPTVTAKVLEGDNGCVGQKFKFQIEGYNDNPPSTLYAWSFGDGKDNVIWNIEDMIENNGSIEHIYTSSSCDAEGDTEHYSAGATPIISIGDKFLIGRGSNVYPIIISRDIKLRLELLVNGIKEDVGDRHAGCVTETLFEFKNNSDFGLNGVFCMEAIEHKWEVYKTNDGVGKEIAIENTDYRYTAGNSSSKENVLIKFLQTGKYKVLFRMANSCSNLEQETGIISVYQNENTTTYSPKTFCLEDDPVVKFETHIDPEVEAIMATGFEWNVSGEAYEFTDGTNKNSTDPHFRFKDAGRFRVHLEKTSLCGIQGYDYWVEVAGKPVASINTPSGFKNGGHCGSFTFKPTAIFTDNGKETFGINGYAIDQYQWTFNNNGMISSSAKQNPDELTFSKLGKSSISLKVHTPCGWSAEDKLEFEIYEIPTPSFSRDDVACQDAVVSYSASPKNMSSYFWGFGGSDIGFGVDVTHSYEIAGTFIDELRVVSKDGCSNTLNRAIEITEKAAVDAGNDAYICSTDLSVDHADASVSHCTSVKWESDGDGHFSDASTMSPTYTLGSKDKSESEIHFLLKAIGDSPCGEVQDSKIVYIVQKPKVEAGQDVTMCKTESSYSMETGIAPGQVNASDFSGVLWTSSGSGTFKDASLLGTTYSPSTDDVLVGSVVLKLEGLPLNHCSETAYDQMTLSFTDVPTADAGADITGCQGEMISLKGEAANQAGVLWTSTGSGVFDDAAMPETNYYPAADEIGEFTLTMTSESIGLCDPVSDHLGLTLIGKPKAFAGEDGEVCANSSYNLSDGSGTGATLYSAESVLWETKGNGSFDSPSSINATYTPGSEDIINGSVVLQLTVKPLAPCAESHIDEMTLTITPLPQANAGDDSAVCQGELYEITGASADNYSSLEWISASDEGFFENKNTLTPTYHPAMGDKGKYTLRLIVYGKGSCAYVEDEMELDITPAPVVDLTDRVLICEDGTYTVSGAIAENIKSYTWETTGTGILSDKNSLTPSYGTGSGETGEISLCLTVEGNGKCASKKDCTILKIVPHPTIEAFDDEVCSDEEYQIVLDDETGNVHAESWSGIEYSTSGDGFFTAQDQFGVKYIPGPIDNVNKQTTITIRANSINPPCEKEYAEDEMILSITPAPEIDAGADDKICQGDNYQLLNATEQNTTVLSWASSNGGSFSDQSSLQATYTPEAAYSGIVQLELQASGNGSCSLVSDQLLLDVIAKPQVNAGGDAEICFEKTYELLATASSFSSVLWNSSGSGSFDDNRILKATYVPSEADYNNGSVVLKVQVDGLSPCLLSVYDEVKLTFAEAPYISAGKDEEICQEEGSYTFTKKTLANPNGVELKNVRSFVWETNGKGSLQNSNTLEPTYIPAPNETGIIRFTLKGDGFSNCDHIEDAMDLYVIPSPKPNFNIGVSCIGDEVSFEDTSTGGLFPLDSWLWNFGDVTFSEEQNPKHEFGEVKEYEVSLTVINNRGCKATIKKTARVNSLPEMKFTHEKVVAINTPVIFTNECFNATSYQWDFGDGSLSVNEQVNHTFSDAGMFDVGLYAESKEGCRNSIHSDLEVIGEPEAAFLKTEDGCGPLQVKFTNTSKGKYLTYFWDFGNGSSSTEANPEPVTFQPGVISDTSYLVQLIVENKAGKARFEDRVVVKPLPVPQFEILPAPYGCSPVLSDIFNQSKGLPSQYTFNFGDGSDYAYEAKNVERPFQHLFITGDTKKVYPITLTASNECGDQSLTKNMTVFPNTAVAVMKVDDSEGCAPFTVEFQNLSTGAGDYLSSDWIFEDDRLEIRDSLGAAVAHTFEKAGVYEVKLIVHDTCASDQTTREIIVHGASEIDFDISYRKLCTEEKIDLKVSEEIRTFFTNFIWDLGDGKEEKGAEVSHHYASEGNYTIRLSAVSIENTCEKTVVKEISIYQKPIAEFTLSEPEGCEPFVVNFTNTSNFADFYQWNFDDGSRSSDRNPTHSFRQGHYSVSLLAETKQGCLDTIRKAVVSRPKPDSKFEIKEEVACSVPFVLEIKNTSTDKELNSYTWDFGNGEESMAANPEREIFLSTGKYRIQLAAENQFHCSDTSSKEFSIYKTPVPGYEICSKTTCEGELIEFKDTSKYQKYTYWEFSDGYTCEGKNASRIFPVFGQYDLLLKVEGEGSCSDSIFKKDAVNVYPKPEADFTWANSNTPPEEVQIPAGIAPPNNGLIQFTNWSREVKEDWIKDQFYSYVWNFDDSKHSDEKDPIHKYTNNGDFQVMLFTESAYSCKDSVSQTVNVNLMSGLFVPNAFNPGNPDPNVAQFLPKGIGLFTYQIEIMDSWGNVVWTSDKIENGRPAEGWNGSRKGEILPQGVYVWKIRAVFKNGESWKGMKIDGRYHREGSLTLIR